MKSSVLLVEDDAMSAGVIARAFVGVKYEHVGTYADCVEWLESNTADLVILDLNLPDSRGQDTVRRFRARFPNQRILIYTGFPLECATRPMRSERVRIAYKGSPELLHTLREVRGLFEKVVSGGRESSS